MHAFWTSRGPTERFSFGILLLAGFACAGPPARAESLPGLDAAAAEFTAQVEAACRAAQAGRLAEPLSVSAPAVGDLLPAATLSFAAATFDRDLDRALERLDQYDALRRGRFDRIEDRATEDRLRTIEAGLESVPGRPEAAESVRVLESYSRDRAARQAERDREAEEDMRRVAEERQLAQARAAIEAEARRQAQDLDRRWQDEMDAQTAREVEAEAAWQREHSPGAFMKNMAWTLAGTTLTSFTGGFAHSLGAGYTDYLIRKHFPDFEPDGRYEKDDE